MFFRLRKCFGLEFEIFFQIYFRFGLKQFEIELKLRIFFNSTLNFLELDLNLLDACAG